jgi:hypothetical protein
MNSAAVKLGTAALLASCTLAGAARSDATPYLTSGSGCSAAATEALVHQFVGDFNTGRLGRIDHLWAPAPRFQWYSAPRRYGDASKKRATLIAYLRTRTHEHERILLIQLGAGYDPRRKLVDFGGKLTRSADDIRPELVNGHNGPRPIQHPFKGAADCVSGHPVLIVWSM